MTIIYVVCLVIGLGFLAWAATFGFAALLNDHAPHKQPGDSPVPPTGGVARCRHRVVLGDPNPSATLSSSRRSA